MRKEIYNVLNSIIINDKYKQVIEKIVDNGLTSNSRIMYEINQYLFSNKRLLASKLYKHAVYEEFGGKIIENFSEKFATGTLKSDMMLQAKDEFKHGRMLATLSNFLVDKNIESRQHSDINETEEEIPDFKDDPKTFVCFIHAAEIRTLIMLHQYLDILRNKNDEQLNRMIVVFESIKNDETQHAAYTGKYINDWLANGEDISSTVINSFLYTNKESWKEISVMASTFSEF